MKWSVDPFCRGAGVTLERSDYLLMLKGKLSPRPRSEKSLLAKKFLSVITTALDFHFIKTHTQIYTYLTHTSALLEGFPADSCWQQDRGQSEEGVSSCRPLPPIATWHHTHTHTCTEPVIMWHFTGPAGAVRSARFMPV